MAERWLRIAHRGASGSAPEHTRPAFERAVQLGADMIELDVQLSRDEELVVHHDLELGRTANGSGSVRNHLLSELKMLDAGTWFSPTYSGEPVLTLNEVLRIVDNRARLNVEIKAPTADWTVLATRLLALLHSHQQLATTVISCFDPGALLDLRAQSRDARIGLLWQHTDFAEAWRWAEELHATSIHPYWMLVSPEVVRTAHERSLQVLTWTVNDVASVQRLVHLGVDGVMSDFPELFSDVRES